MIKPFDYEASLNRLQKRVNNMQAQMENAITSQRYYNIYDKEWVTTTNAGVKFGNGHTAKQSLIRSQQLIFELHEFVKEEMIAYGVDDKMIFPRVGNSKPEIPLSGFFKSKQQDISIVPSSIESTPQIIDWGLVQYQDKKSKLGRFKEERVLSVNVRSQLSSLSKNYDTLFERMIAEPVNLHMQFPELVTGELYLIPAYEYLDKDMRDNKLTFSSKRSNIPVYINFFNTLNDYDPHRDPVEPYKYNKSGLLIVDFSKKIPKIYDSTAELVRDELIDDRMENPIENISPVSLVHNLLTQYNDHFNLL